MPNLAAYTGMAFATASGLALSPGATVEVRRKDTGALAAIFSDEAGTTPKANPFTSHATTGAFDFYVAGLERGFDVTVTKAGGGESATVHVSIGTAGQKDIADFTPAVITTKGDIIVGGATGLPARKAAGTNGKIPVLDSSQADGWLYAAKRFDPCGRLTLTSGTPVTSADVTAAATVYFTPYKGDVIELYDGAGWLPFQFAELSQALADATKSPAAAVAARNYDLFVWNDAGTLRCTRGPAWRNRGQVITGATNATPISIAAAAHGLVTGDQAVVSHVQGNTAANGTWTVTVVDANNFTLNGSVGNGVYVAGTGSFAARGVGAATTELELFEGRYVNKNAITNGAAARRGLFVGTIGTNPAAATVDDSKSKRFVWNMYNRVARDFANPTETADNWLYGSATIRQANGNAANKFEFVRGLNEDALVAHLNAGLLSTGAGAQARTGIGIDTTTVHTALPAIADVSNSLSLQATVHYAGMPGLGYHYCAWLESSNGSVAVTFYGDNGSSLTSGTAMQSGLMGEMLA